MLSVPYDAVILPGKNHYLPSEIILGYDVSSLFGSCLLGNDRDIIMRGAKLPEKDARNLLQVQKRVIHFDKTMTVGTDGINIGT